MEEIYNISMLDTTFYKGKKDILEIEIIQNEFRHQTEKLFFAEQFKLILENLEHIYNPLLKLIDSKDEKLGNVAWDLLLLFPSSRLVK